MKKLLSVTLTICVFMLICSCSTTSTAVTKGTAYKQFYNEKPKTVLVMAPINQSQNVDAKDYFYTTLNVPIIEHGYYVIPPIMAMQIMQKESAYDAELFLEGSLTKFKQLFGADIAVFTIIKQWDKSAIAGKVMIEVEYIFRSTLTGEIMFKREAMLQYNTGNVSGAGGIFGLVATMATTALKTAITDYSTVAILCNNDSLADLPSGQYSPYYLKDEKQPSMVEKIIIRQ